MVRKMRWGPFTTTVQGGWVGPRQFHTSKVAVYRSTPTVHEETHEHYRDTFTTYGEDPSTPDYLRSHETTTVHTGRQTWEETRSHTTYEDSFEGYRDSTDMWRDITWDGGSTTRTRWRALDEGNRVYHVDVSLFGRTLHARLHDATHSTWEHAPRRGWGLMGGQALAMIAEDVAAWRDRVWRIRIPARRDALEGLVCVPGHAELLKDGLVRIHYDGTAMTGEQRPECPVEHDDLLLLAITPHGAGVAAIHNVRTGGTWRNHVGSTGPSTATVLREHALTIAAGAIGLTAAGVGLYDTGLQYMTAPVVLASIAAGYLLGRRAKLRVDVLKARAAHNRDRIDTVVAHLMTLGWRCIGNLPPLSQREQIPGYAAQAAGT
jgi:hypothetical protein